MLIFMTENSSIFCLFYIINLIQWKYIGMVLPILVNKGIFGWYIKLKKKIRVGKTIVLQIKYQTDISAHDALYNLF